MAYKIVLNDYLMHMSVSNNKRGNRYHDNYGKFTNSPYTSRDGQRIIDEANRRTSVTPPPQKYGYKYEKSSNLSDDELKKRNQRKQNEKKYEQLYNPGRTISGIGGHLSDAGRAMSNVRIKGEKGPKTDLSQYSDQELQRIINRARNEAEYERLFNPERVSAGQKFVDGLSTTLSIAGGALAVAGAGYALYKKIAG